MSFKTYSNPLIDLDEEIISSEFNPIHNEDLDSTLKNDRFDTKSYLLESLLNRDESIPPGIDNDDSDSEGDNLFLERLLHDDPIPLPDTLDFSYDLSSIPENVKTLAKGFCTQSSFPQLQLGIILLHLAGSQPMLKSSYKAEDGVIISIPSLVEGVADVVVEIKGTGVYYNYSNKYL
nr:hypothetical protein [Tanacetum cinerariifolium]